MDNFNLEIERAVLGNCILSKKKFAHVLDRGLTSDEFYNASNKKIFDCLLESYSNNNSTDLLIVCKIASKYKILPSLITALVEESINLTDIEVYIDELFNLRIIRERFQLANDILSRKIENYEDIERQFKDIELIKSKAGNSNSITTLDKVKMLDIYEMEKIPTGFKKIDDILQGFVMGSLNIITGYNGNGKSTLVNQMCIAESLAQGYKVFVYSPELTNSNLKNWLYATIANDEHFIYKTRGLIEDKMLSNIATGDIDNWIKDKLYIYEDESIATDEKQLLLDMNRLVKQGVKVFIIDNLMKIEIKDIYKNEYIAQKIFVNKLKNFARKYGVIVHLVAHPRKPQPGSCKITKFDIAGTGDITNIADYAIAIKKNTKKEKINDKTLKDAYIEILKDRINGREFGFDLYFDKDRRRFYSDRNELNKDYGYSNFSKLIQVDLEKKLNFV